MNVQLTSDREPLSPSKKRAATMQIKRAHLVVVGVFLFILVGYVFYTFYQSKRSTSGTHDYLISHVSNAPLLYYSTAAVSSDASDCAIYGRQMLEMNGSAIDAAISVALCMGLILPHSMGLGGGCFINYYDNVNKKSFIFDGREASPMAATQDIFRGNATQARLGPLAIGIPGELAAYYEAHKKFGKLPWRELFVGPIKLAKSGYKVNNHLAKNLKKYRHTIIESDLREMFFNPATDELYQEGDTIKNPKMALTYETLASSSNPMELFYHGRMMQQLVSEIQQKGGIVTVDDFKNYKVNVYEAERYPLPKGYVLHVPKAPAGGQLLGFLTSVVANFTDICRPEIGHSLKSTSKFYHIFTEACKFTYSRRMGLGDPEYDDVSQLMAELSPSTFNQTNSYFKKVLSRLDRFQTHPVEYYEADTMAVEDHGTAHLSIMDAQGNAVSLTSSVNIYFGSQVQSQSTGIIFNDQMDDFSSPNITNYFNIPPSPFNKIQGGKRPLSSMCPVVVSDRNGESLLSLGAAGGTLIISGVAQTLIRVLYMKENLKQAIDQYRIHHQLYGNTLAYEPGFDVKILDTLHRQYGHQLAEITNRRSILTGIQRLNGTLTAHTDFRKGGSVDGI